MILHQPNQTTFHRGAEVLAVYGKPLIARRKTKVRIREVIGEREMLQCHTGDLLEALSELDYVMVPDEGRPYPCKKDIFHRSWEPDLEKPGYYRRSALASIVPLPEGHTATLMTLEGQVTVTHPDFIAIGVDDEVYPNTREWVEANLEILS